MPFLLVRHKAEDHAKWKRVFDESAGMLWASGCTEARIFRNADDPQEVLVLGERDELAKARQFTQAQSGEMEDTLQCAGIIGQPDGVLLEEIKQLTP